jgi:hypothetical protein
MPEIGCHPINLVFSRLGLKPSHLNLNTKAVSSLSLLKEKRERTASPGALQGRYGNVLIFLAYSSC